MSDPADPRSWVEKAEEDYALVLSSLRRKRPLTYGATFHAQQCAEKYLKALLVQQEQEPPRIHDLIAVAGLCRALGIILPIEEDELSLLTRFATMTRYPGEDLTVDEARHAFEIAKAVRKFARPLLR